MRDLRSTLALLLLAVLPLGFGGCAHLHARTQPQMPPLATPPPPPHHVTPPPPLLPSTPAEPEQAAPSGQTAPKAPAEKPEPPGKPRTPVASPPPESRGAEEGPKTPPPTLQTAPSGEAGAQARSIRDTLGKATRDLGGVDYQRLGSDAKAQYDTAQRFIRQADAALKSQNYIVARNLADKAAVLAALLRGGA